MTYEKFYVRPLVR